VRLLVVEDDEDVAEELSSGLRRYGHEVDHVGTGTEALERWHGVDLVLLDLGLPDLDGFEVCRRLRACSDVPIIVVSARSQELDRVLGLRVGADDYLVKPYGFNELLARIDAVLRRGRTRASGQAGEICLGALVIDPRMRRVLVKGEDIALTRKEFDLLALLASEPGTVFTREDILREVWSETWFGASRTLDVHVGALRSKLGDRGWIETVRGVGFRMSQEPPE